MRHTNGVWSNRFWDQRTQEDVWQSYSQVNMKFREKIVEVYNDGDLIWIHGFHLLVLPSFITKTIPKAKTALFLHTPFPSSEIFRTLSVREDLLRGMLNADHIGFHLFEYARHFVTCVRRLLGLTYDMENGQLAVHYNGRTVAISSIHVGVDISSLRSIQVRPEVETRLDELKQRFGGRKVVLGVDRLERIRGLPLKLLAFEKFLKKYPAWHDKVVLYQVRTHFTKMSRFTLYLVEPIVAGPLTIRTGTPMPTQSGTLFVVCHHLSQAFLTLLVDCLIRWASRPTSVGTTTSARGAR